MKKEKKKTFGLYLGIIFLALLFSFTGCKSREAEFLAGEENVSEEAPPEEEETPGEEAPEATVPPRKIFVDVCGAVANPGVYELDADSRVFHAIDAAGGFFKGSGFGIRKPREKHKRWGTGLYSHQGRGAAAVPAGSLRRRRK